MTDPRWPTLEITVGLAVLVAVLRDRRGAPPLVERGPQPTRGLELVISEGGSIKPGRFGRSVLVGRAPNADIRIDDPRVSRLHARIEMRDDSVYVEDLDSRNGTRVGDAEVIGTRRLMPGDEVLVGAASILFRGVGTWK